MARLCKSLLIFEYHVNTFEKFEFCYSNTVRFLHLLHNEESLMGSTTDTSYQSRGGKPASGSFEEAFYSRVDSIVQRGKAVGITITDI